MEARGDRIGWWRQFPGAGKIAYRLQVDHIWFDLTGGPLFRESVVPRDGVRIMPQNGLRLVRRVLPDGNNYFFFVNRADVPIEGWVQLGRTVPDRVPDGPADRGPSRPSRGETNGRRRDRRLPPTPTRRIDHRPDSESRRSRSDKPWRYTGPPGPPVAVTGMWNVKFIDGGPALPAAFTTLKTRLVGEARRCRGPALRGHGPLHDRVRPPRRRR